MASEIGESHRASGGTHALPRHGARHGPARRTTSDPTFARELLHAHSVFSRIDSERRVPFLSHSHPHLAKLPATHPEFFREIPHTEREGGDTSSWTVWAALKRIRFPKKPGAATLSLGEGTTELPWVAARVHWSVLSVEILVTAFVISFSVISFWKGTWTILDKLMVVLYGTGLTAQAYGVATVLVIGVSMLCIVIVLGYLFSHLVYKPYKPRTWGELVWRTAADRAVQYVQAWSGICIWKGVWDLWTFFILPDSPWVSAVVAHVVGLSMLLLTFSFRSAVTPPMVYVEDSIMSDTSVSRWDLLSKFIFWQSRRRLLSRMEREWEENEVKIAD